MVLPATLDPTGPLDDSIGSFYIVMLFSAILYGFCLLQTFIYFRRYAQDRWYTRTAVVALITSDTIHLLFVAMGVYHYVISNYHNPDKLQYVTWPLLMESAFVIANSNIVQVFYIYRIWQLSKREITFALLCGFFLLLVCVETGVVITWLVLAMEMTKWFEMFKIAPLAVAIFSLSCSLDILIAGSLCFLLHRSRTGFKRSDSIINRLILFFISTGSLTAIFAILALVCLFLIPYSPISGALSQTIGHLYTNSFLTTLNARSTIKSVNETEFKSNNTLTHEITSSKQKDINIRIDKTVTQRMSQSMATRRDSVDNFPAQRGGPLSDLS